MGITGLIGILFVVGHVAGNLLVFRGAEEMNAYARFLRSTGELLWIVRIVLLAAVILHVIAATQLTLQSRAARPVGYARRDSQVATLASRTMRIGGIILLIFIPLHILHFTTGSIRPGGYFDEVNVYGNIVESFRVWWVTLFYVIAMASLGLHLFHGVWSSGRSLGASPPSPKPLRRRIALAVALFAWIGFTAIPIGVFVGVVR